jgi:hypothetical protein
MKLITFDLGKHIGTYNGKEAHTEFLGDPPKGWGADEYRPIRFGKALLFIQSYCLEEEPDVIGYERPFSRGLGATRAGWGYAGIIEACAYIHGAAVLDPLNNTTKKWAYPDIKNPTMNVTKEFMIQRAFELTGLDLDEHSADATVIWHYIKEKAETG